MTKKVSHTGVHVSSIPIGYSMIAELPIGITFVENMTSEQKLSNIDLASRND